nr:restriction endonuclease subunit S [uncultured Intestinibacter sp.]
MEYVNLKDYIETMESGKRPKGGAVNEGIPSLGGEHITSEGKFNLRSNKLKYVPEDYYNELKKGKIQVNDILVVKDGATTGKTAIVTEKFPFKEACVNEHLFLIRTKEELKAKYLYYYFLSDLGQHQILKDFRGATIGGISREFININLYIPNIEIQEKIIKILDKSQELIYKKKEQIFNLDELVKSRFIEMFGSQPNSKRGWEIAKIGDIVTDVRYGTSKSSVIGGKYPYLRMNNITYEGELDLKDLKYIDISDDELEKCVVRKGDVLFNRTNSIDLIGKTCVFNLEEPMVIAGYIIRIRLKEQVLPVYLSIFLNSDYGKQLLKSMAKGAVNQANINAQELKSIKISIPPIELQNQFADFVTQVDKLKFEMEKSLKELEDNFNSLMQKAFKGELF